MSNIAICFSQWLIDYNATKIICMYESLAKVLCDNGNNVYILNMNLVITYNKNARAVRALKKFNPDLIISFNNYKPVGIDKIVDCPIVVWDADCVDYFYDQHNLKKSIERYHFFTCSKNWINDYINFGAKKNRIFYIPPSTLLKPMDVKQDKKISIIASKFDYPCSLKHKMAEDSFRKSALNIYKDAFFSDKNCIQEQQIFEREDHFKDKFDNFELWAITDLRNLLLANLIDLDLSIYGVNWERIFNSFPMLMACYKPDPIFSLNDNQYIYNSSKVCININHPQTRGYAYSWRVMDIMATNGCLVSSPSIDLKESTRGFVDIPFFDNQFDARALCLKILNENNFRNDIVAASQEYIRCKGNMYDRISLIEKIVGIRLLDKDVSPGDISYFYFKNYKKSRSSIIKFKTILLKKYELLFRFHRV